MTNKEAIERLIYIKEHQIDPEDYEVFDYAIKALENERQEGEWDVDDFNSFLGLGYYTYKCSVCNKKYCGSTNYCPNCGADMRGEENEIN